jgi:stalled ribosome alternative rescue factor ArfA
MPLPEAVFAIRARKNRGRKRVPVKNLTKTVVGSSLVRSRIAKTVVGSTLVRSRIEKTVVGSSLA